MSQTNIHMQPPTCVRCSKSHSTPHAFLLSCTGGCSKSWHHRASLSLHLCFHHRLLSGCHQPPVSDSELIARIKAFNDNDIENSINAWMCRRCLKRSNSSTLPHGDSPSIPLRGNTSTLIQSLYVKYNLSSSWIQNRHPNISSLPSSNRKRASRKISPSKCPPVVAQDPCNFYCISWLRKRQESATLV